MRLARAAVFVLFAVGLTRCQAMLDFSPPPGIGSDGGAVDTASGDDVDQGPEVLGCGRKADGLIAYYPMDQDAGSMVLDCSGNDLHGALPGGASFVPGIRGTALSLDNVGVPIAAEPTIRLTGPLTVAAWTRPEDPLRRQTILSKCGEDGERGWALEITPDLGGGQFFVSSDGDDEFAARLPGPLVAAGRWTHLAGVYDPGRGAYLYADGVLVNSVDGGPTSMFDAPVTAMIGGRSYAYFYIGLLDDVRIYDRALTPGEIAALATK